MILTVTKTCRLFLSYILSLDVRYVNSNIRWTGVKAERQLQISYRPLEDTLRDEAAWFQAHGYLK